MENPIKTSHSIAILGACFLLALLFIIQTTKQLDTITGLIQPNTQLADISGAGSNLVGYWTFDEGTGTTAGDSSGSGNAGTLSGSTLPSWTTGKIGQALSFDGVDDYINVTVGNGLPIYSTTTPYSVAFWVKATQPLPYVSYMTAYSENHNTSPSYFQIDVTNNAPYQKARVLIKNNAGTWPLAVESNAVVFDNTWHHVVWTDNVGTASLYVDGVKDTANFNYTPAPTTYLKNSFIGKGNSYFNGSLDDVRVYNRVLSQAEITQLYNYTGAPAGGGGTAQTCTSFIYSGWSTCTNGSQTQTVTSSLPSGCIGGSPITTQSCTVITSPVATNNTYYVSDSIGNDNNSGTSLAPFKTIQKAYNLTQPGDTVIVKPGIYKELYSATDGIGILLNRSGSSGKPITIKSEVKGRAILDGQNIQGHNEMIFISGSYNIVDGFEIKNGWLGAISIYNYLGGGNYNQIINNNIHNNGNIGDPTSAYGQGGIFTDHGTYGNQFINNYIHHEGRIGGQMKGLDHGLYLCGNNEIVFNNILTNNAGSGLQIAGYTTVTNMKVYNNVIAWNGVRGIVLWLSMNGIDIKNNIIYKNTGYGIDSYDAHGSRVVFDHNLFYENLSGNTNFTGGGSDYTYTLGTNISGQNPNFIAETSDFQLTSGSPAINTGLSLTDVTTDFSGITRPQGGSYDIGVYEYTGVVTPPTPIIGDFDHNGVVNSLDLSMLTDPLVWNHSSTTFDLNHDGIVNSLDYVIMVQNWTMI